MTTSFDFFTYQNNKLFCENVSLEELAQKNGTPLYVYSYNALKTQFKNLDSAFALTDHLICYSMKANSNKAILKTFAQLGGGVDVVSGGELQRALDADCDPQKIVFSGVGKTSEEIHFALSKNILQFNVESEMELANIQRIAEFSDKKAPIAIRVNPDVDPKTHPYISTGLKKNKFGISHKRAVEIYKKAQTMSHIEIVGIDCHIGSQLIDLQPFTAAMEKLRELILELKNQGIHLKHVDIGGGLGIRYKDEAAQSPEEYAKAILAPLKNLGLKIILEPGRYLVGNSGCLVTKTIYTKEGEENRHFTIIDAAFNDLMRPSLYQAYHEILPTSQFEKRPQINTDIVGPICETGDSFAKERQIQQTMPGEYLAIMSAGAYGMSMASTYNSRPRVSEIMVNDKNFVIIRKTDKLEHIVGREVMPEFLKEKF